jgi:predicted metal-dependent phosphoesterase TrpH
VIAIVHAARGLVSIAHPGRTRIDEHLPGLRDAGLDAIEVYHSDHDEPTTERYAALAGDLGVLVTGGSDFHDPASKLRPGSVTLPWRHWDRLVAR